MIQSLRYEPRGQRQRFEPRERQDGSTLEHRHIHLHLHLHLDLGARVRRASQSAVTRVTTIFAAFMAAFSLFLTLFLQAAFTNYEFDTHQLFSFALGLTGVGTLLGLAAVLVGGLPLVVTAWRSTPRVRVLLTVPLFAIAAIFLAAPGMIGNVLLLAGLMLVAAGWRPTWHKRFLFLVIPLLLAVHFFVFLPLGSMLLIMSLILSNKALLALWFYGVPLIMTIALVRAIRRAEISDEWLRFAEVAGRVVAVAMLMLLAGVLLWGVGLILFAPGVFASLLSLFTYPWQSWLLIVLGMLIAVVVALRAAFARTPRKQARPHDDAPGNG